MELAARHVDANEIPVMAFSVGEREFVERVLTLNARSTHFDRTFGINVRAVYLLFGSHCH
jgi:hypothetical protein